MTNILKRAANLSLATNIFLFIIKGTVGILSNSIAVISDAINSLTDIVSSAAIKYSVNVSLQKPDKDHQFGHHAAQPIAVFVIALFSAIVGIEIIKESISRIINPREVQISFAVYLVLVVTVIIKLILMRYQSKVSKQYKSPGLKASAVDSLNDVLASVLSLIGVAGVELGFPKLDGIIGIFIALFILKSGYEIAKENINYLMGKAADEDIILEIANKALKIEGVKGINDLRSHYVGNKFHVEIHIEVDKNFATEKSHEIGVQTQNEILKLQDINKVFVHIDPV
ncbi:MAG: cation diffusion facilitator family transporter [Ignavibacteriaceae bacterium]